MIETHDLIVIGGGRAASLAVAAAKAGMRTALIERDRLGGACPNRGCVPSKLLIGYAEAVRKIRESQRHFIDADLQHIDLPRIFAEVGAEIEPVDGRYAGRLEAAGATLIRGEARFTGHKQIEVNGRTLTAPRIVVATGSRPAPVPAPFAHLPVWTSDHLFPLEGPPPRRLLVIGGGFIATEMAAFFSAVGVETHLFARDKILLPREDATIAKIFQQEFSREVDTHLDAILAQLEHDGATFTATFRIGGELRTFEADRVLFAIGRRPNTESLDLGKTGLAADARGFLPVNHHLETAIPGIHAAGDVNGRHMLQHAAAFEVHYLRQRFLKNLPTPIDDALMPHAVFSHPEIAAVGKTEAELVAAGTPHVAVVEDWLASARAMALRVTYPRVKLLVSPDDHRILGCHLIGPESATLLHQVLAVMHLKNDVRELAAMIHIHPALNECLLAAAVKAIAAVRASKTA